MPIPCAEVLRIAYRSPDMSHTSLGEPAKLATIARCCPETASKPCKLKMFLNGELMLLTSCTPAGGNFIDFSGVQQLYNFSPLGMQPVANSFQGYGGSMPLAPGTAVQNVQTFSQPAGRPVRLVYAHFCILCNVHFSCAWLYK